MGILAFTLIGLLSGFLAGKLVEGHGFGLVSDILIGLAGALVGGFLFMSSSIGSESFAGAVVTSTVGAALFLLLAGLLYSSIYRRRKI